MGYDIWFTTGFEYCLKYNYRPSFDIYKGTITNETHGITRYEWESSENILKEINRLQEKHDFPIFDLNSYSSNVDGTFSLHKKLFDWANSQEQLDYVTGYILYHQFTYSDSVICFLE
jgi:hypothetical protein